MIILILCSCQGISNPKEFVNKNIQTNSFKIATWQKINNPDSVYKIYIEGDGYAFNAYGQPTKDPTPKSNLMRELAFNDKNQNVVYLSRPCQYIKSGICTQQYWTTARFAPEVINAEYEVIKQIAGNNPVILIGFSGGAQIAGLTAVTKQDLNIKKVITIAGNLDHVAWTKYHHLPQLDKSLNLADYKQSFQTIPQTHYVGSNDKVIPDFLVKNMVNGKGEIITIKGASHNTGWKDIYPMIWNEK